MDTLFSISTYRKNLACDQLLETLLNHNYDKDCMFLIADDSDDLQAKFVYEKYKKQCKIVYVGGYNGGISINKNRAIKYFIAKNHFKELILCDDDLLFVRENLLNHLRMVCNEDIKLPFVTAAWSDFGSKDDLSKSGVTGNNWVKDFPIIGETQWTTWHKGSHGCFLYFQREIIEKIGYYNIFSYFYSHEHSAYISRALLASKLSPQLHPIIKYSNLWFHGNNIPNDYEVDMDKVWNVNGKEYEELISKLEQGYGIYNNQHGLNKKKEILLKD